MLNCTRRNVLAAMAGAAVAPRRVFAANDPWALHAAILKRIAAPKFPSKDFPVTRYGAKSGGKVDCTEAFRSAIEAAARAGGGRVVVPAGVWLSGAIHLKSNVNLVVEKGSTIKFFTDPKYYPIVLTRFEGLECMNYSPLIYALDQTNIAITGEGTLDGQAFHRHFRWRKGNARGGW